MFKRPVRRVSRVFLHCSDSDYPEHSNLRTIRKWHLARGFADVGYHYFIGFDGIIETGRSLERLPAAQRDHNTDSIAICLAGGQHQSAQAFTQQQYESLRSLCGAINESYGGQISFHGHTEVSDKACPVFDYPLVLGLSPSGYMRQPRQNLAKSRTVKGGQIASGGAAVTAAANAVSAFSIERLNRPIELASNLDPTAIVPPAPVVWQLPGQHVEETANNIIEIGQAILGFVPWAAVLMIFIGVAIMIHARLDDHERGLR